MYVLACMLCLIWGCDALVLRRQEALVGPLMGIELSHHRGMLQGTFLLDAPHATHSHTHTRKVTNIYSAVKKKNTNKTLVAGTWCTCVLHKARVSGENANTEAASPLTVYTAVTWVSWRPRASLRGLGSSG